MKRSTVLFGLFFLPLYGIAQDANAPIVPKYLVGVGIDQKLNAPVPLNAQFTDESGRSVELRSYLGRRPAILALVYYTCPALCDQILHGITMGIRPLSLRPGVDFDVIAISINPSEGPSDAAAKKRELLAASDDTSAAQAWHFLTGNETEIRKVADAVGYHYRYDPKTKMFFHGAGIMVLTPDGRLARYLYGIDYASKDLKLGLIEASHNRIGTPVDRILLFCYHYDPLTGKYTATVMNVIRAAAAVFLLLLVAGGLMLWRRDVRMHRHAPDMALHL